MLHIGITIYNYDYCYYVTRSAACILDEININRIAERYENKFYQSVTTFDDYDTTRMDSIKLKEIVRHYLDSDRPIAFVTDILHPFNVTTNEELQQQKHQPQQVQPKQEQLQLQQRPKQLHQLKLQQSQYLQQEQQLLLQQQELQQQHPRNGSYGTAPVQSIDCEHESCTLSNRRYPPSSSTLSSPVPPIVFITTKPLPSFTSLEQYYNRRTNRMLTSHVMNNITFNTTSHSNYSRPMYYSPVGLTSHNERIMPRRHQHHYSTMGVSKVNNNLDNTKLQQKQQQQQHLIELHHKNNKIVEQQQQPQTTVSLLKPSCFVKMLPREIEFSDNEDNDDVISNKTVISLSLYNEMKCQEKKKHSTSSTMNIGKNHRPSKGWINNIQSSCSSSSISSISSCSSSKSTLTHHSNSSNEGNLQKYASCFQK
jgi:hypothetical protein